MARNTAMGPVTDAGVDCLLASNTTIPPQRLEFDSLNVTLPPGQRAVEDARLEVVLNVPPQRCVDARLETVLQSVDSRLDSKLKPFLERVHQLEEKIQNDVGVVLQRVVSLEAQDRALSLSAIDAQYKRFLSMVERANQRLEDERSSLKSVVDSLREKQETLQHNLEVEQLQRLKDSENLKLQLSKLGGSRDLGKATREDINEATSTAVSSAPGANCKATTTSMPGSALGASCSASHDWHEFAELEVQLAVGSAEASIRKAAEQTCASIEHSIRADLVQLAVDSAEARLRKAAEEMCANIEQSIRSDLSAMQLNVQTLFSESVQNKTKLEDLLQSQVRTRMDGIDTSAPVLLEIETDPRWLDALDEACNKWIGRREAFSPEAVQWQLGVISQGIHRILRAQESLDRRVTSIDTVLERRLPKMTNMDEISYLKLSAPPPCAPLCDGQSQRQHILQNFVNKITPTVTELRSQREMTSL